MAGGACNTGNALPNADPGTRLGLSGRRVAPLASVPSSTMDQPTPRARKGPRALPRLNRTRAAGEVNPWSGRRFAQGPGGADDHTPGCHRVREEAVGDACDGPSPRGSRIGARPWACSQSLAARHGYDWFALGGRGGCGSFAGNRRGVVGRVTRRRPHAGLTRKAGAVDAATPRDARSGLTNREPACSPFARPRATRPVRTRTASPGNDDARDEGRGRRGNGRGWGPQPGRTTERPTL